MSAPLPCDLCGLDIGPRPFTLDTPDGPRRFCCEGCRGIYEMLNEIKSDPDSGDDNDATPSRRSP